MERQGSMKEAEKKGVIRKTLDRCRSFGHGRSAGSRVSAVPPPSKSKSWPRTGRKQRVAPEGCFTVYVGAEKERFVIKTECVNHPLFVQLLDEAERVYGHTRGGPLELPCDVDHFHLVLWEIEQETESVPIPPSRRSFSRSSSGYHKLSLNSRLMITGPSCDSQVFVL